MADYLLADLQTLNGYRVVPGRPKPGEAAVALTPEGRCIFGNPTTARSTYAPIVKETEFEKKMKPLLANKSEEERKKIIQEEAKKFQPPKMDMKPKIIHYDDEVERQRRLLCDTILGQIMLDNPRFALQAVGGVNNAIREYWRKIKERNLGKDVVEKVVTEDGRHVSNETSFGRLKKVTPDSKIDKESALYFTTVVDLWISELQGTDLPKMMSLHDIFLKVYCRFDMQGEKPMDVAKKFNFREDWYEGSERGRTNAKDSGSVQPVETPGLITDCFTIPWQGAFERCHINLHGARKEARKRGTDMFIIDGKKLSPAFKKVLAENNLVFAASASGTTSTLLTSAKIFFPSIFSQKESTKQYLMGCVAYLVGSGMHTAHEVFYTGALAGLDYKTGKYIDMLPTSFLSSLNYEYWATEFWDIIRPDRPTPR